MAETKQQRVERRARALCQIGCNRSNPSLCYNDGTCAEWLDFVQEAQAIETSDKEAEVVSVPRELLNNISEAFDTIDRAIEAPQYQPAAFEKFNIRNAKEYLDRVIAASEEVE